MSTKNTFSIVSQIGAISVIGLSSLMISNTASAESRTMVGSACLPQDDNQTNLVRTRTGRIENRSNKKRIVACHLSIEKARFDSDISGRVSVIDNSGSKHVNCLLRVRSLDGGFLGSSSRSTTDSFISTEPKTLTFGNVNFASKAAPYIRCSIPGVDFGRKSSIVTFNVKN